MNLYKLNDKHVDKCFLDGDVVACKASIPIDVYKAHPITVGSFLVVELSNGKKFKGQITNVKLYETNRYAVGVLEIVRFTKIAQPPTS